MSDELREKVAALLNANCFEGCEPGADEVRACVYPPCRCRTVADAAIALARDATLEEAAKVAAGEPAEFGNINVQAGYNLGRMDAAAAIRALKA